MIRRFYTNQYKSVDKYDTAYYDFLPEHDEPRWEAVFLWAALFMAAHHSWAAWCELRRHRVNMRTFLEALVEEWVEMDFIL